MNLRPTKVCFATGAFTPTIGGLSTSATRVATMLAAAGFEMHVVVPVTGEVSASIPKRLKLSESLFVYRVPIGSSVRNNDGRALANCVAKLDKIESFGLFHGYFFPMAHSCCLTITKTRKRRPLVTSIRGSDAIEWTEPKKVNISKYILKNTTYLTSVNRALLNRVLAVSGDQPGTRLIKNSIRIDGARVWSTRQMSRGAIGTVGAFQACKEIEVLVRAFVKVDSSFRTSLNLIGDFLDMDYKNIVLEQIKQLRIESDFDLTGYLDQVEVYGRLLKLNVFVMTSSHEGFPNALLEAAALGVPIVTTAFAGIEDYLTHNDHALIVPVGDEDALSNAISMVLSDDRLAMKLSAGARKLRNLTAKSEGRQWVELYRDSLVAG